MTRMAMDMEVDAYAYALRASTPKQCPLRASTPKQCPLVTYKHVTITAPHKLPTVGVRVTACASKKEGGNKGGGNKEGTRGEGEKGRRDADEENVCVCTRE
eukprot:CAMPEP_0179459280 /NCGR_PEP_ID=MMETSP0799-20121207/42648_1 /TAXON_ID=46947 /ORGANISM="Geminigera cryophila, Strain CCMP2564" /LENGTH=100 /DNA_ID=CAMNT_0021261009 /DNA_START=894 /DNA_END=1196 /DNA_ORIENTATION=-